MSNLFHKSQGINDVNKKTEALFRSCFVLKQYTNYAAATVVDDFGESPFDFLLGFRVHAIGFLDYTVLDYGLQGFAEYVGVPASFFVGLIV